jgi:hypothetical protein
VLKQEQAAAVGLHAAAQHEIAQLKEQIKADKTTIEQQIERIKKDEALHNSYYEALDAQGLICGVCFESEQQLISFSNVLSSSSRFPGFFSILGIPVLCGVLMLLVTVWLEAVLAQLQALHSLSCDGVPACTTVL